MLDAAQREGLKTFWVPVRPSAYIHSPITKFQAAHAPDRQLSRLRVGERDQAFVHIGEKLAKALGVKGV